MWVEWHFAARNVVNFVTFLFYTPIIYNRLETPINPPSLDLSLRPDPSLRHLTSSKSPFGSDLRFDLGRSAAFLVGASPEPRRGKPPDPPYSGRCPEPRRSMSVVYYFFYMHTSYRCIHIFYLDIYFLVINLLVPFYKNNLYELQSFNCAKFI